MPGLHSSKRRPLPLKPEDYDHEIVLVDHSTNTTAPTQTRTRTPSPAQNAEDIERFPSPVAPSDSSSRPLRNHASKKMRQQVARRKYGKFKGQIVPEGEVPEDYDTVSGGETDGRSVRGSTEEPEHAENGHANGKTDTRGRPRSGRKKEHEEHESVIDILYENERGGFLCGIPLFSKKALGGLDHPPWTNVAHKPSATDITNAQVPDPSWEWSWKEWSINHDEQVDEDGWEYAFAYGKAFSWHGPSWWNSFVRRRVWIRKRAKKHAQPKVQEAHMLNEDYFTIHPVTERSRSRSTNGRTLTLRYSVSALAKQEMEETPVLEDLTDVPSLMKALKLARIDREKLEAVENFVEHGEDELYYLREKMHEVMGMFIFQASRKLLLEHLLKLLNEASEAQREHVEGKKDPDPAKVRRLDNLEAVVKHADEEVKRLEFWSDVKDIAESGVTKGALDEDQGWDDSKWTGLDRSGPADVISQQNAIGKEDCPDEELNGNAAAPQPDEKGKGKADQ
jgi:hypothetical protein